MVVIPTTTYCFLVLYAAMVLAFAIGWKRTPHYTEKKPMKSPVSLVVCCKNEAENLPPLLRSIEEQTHNNFEVIFVDDHSTDDTAKILDEFAKKHTFARCISASGNGKKNALIDGILAAKNEIIVCTDADCTLQAEHLQIISNYFAENEPDLLLGAVRMADDGTLFQQLQALEFASLIASTAGACGAQMPVMCNGANLAFKKSVWLQCHSALHSELPSGDDVFLLHAVKKMGGKIAFLKHEKTVVTTQPQATLRDFVNQRARWTSKAASYTDAATIGVACLVFGLSALILLDFIGIFWHFATIVPFCIAFCAKFAIDTAFLALFLPFTHQIKLLCHTLALSAIYPIYVVYSALRGFVGKFRWKS